METLLDPGPQLLLDWRAPDEGSRRLRAGVISVLLHAVAILLLPLASRLDFTKVDEVKEPPPLKQYTRLVAPRLTQKEPNREKVAKEVRLENLLPQPEVRQE